MTEALALVPHDVLNVALVLALAFFIGVEREEHKQHDAGYAFGGVRTFPLIGLVSYALALIGAAQILPWAIGFAVIGGFMSLSYFHKLSLESPAGLTTEMSALTTYVVGGLVQREHYWIATTIAVVSVILLELKKGLEGLTTRFASAEIITVAKFLVLVAVILPVVPDQEMTRFHINPFKTWLVVVAVSGVSFASYVLQRVLKQRGGVLLSAILGGAYSSTLTTIVLARRSRQERRPNLFAGSILTASGIMYARLVVLIAFFNVALAIRLAPAFGVLGLLGAVTGWIVSRRSDGTDARSGRREGVRNPLELGAALLFALVFVAVLILTHLAQAYLGQPGLYSLAAIMGVTDVDPFIMGLTQASPTSVALGTATGAIVIAAASNNLVKAIYAFSFADRTTGRRSFALLAALAIVGLAPLAWV